MTEIGSFVGNLARVSEDTEQYNNVLIIQADSLSFACF